MNREHWQPPTAVGWRTRVAAEPLIGRDGTRYDAANIGPQRLTLIGPDLNRGQAVRAIRTARLCRRRLDAAPEGRGRL